MGTQVDSGTSMNLLDLPYDMIKNIEKFWPYKLEWAPEESSKVWCKYLNKHVHCNIQLVFEVPRNEKNGKIQVKLHRSLDTTRCLEKSLGVDQRKIVEEELKLPYDQTWDDISEIRFCQVAQREDGTLSGSLELERKTTNGQQQIIKCPDWLAWYGEQGKQKAVEKLISALQKELPLMSEAVNEFEGVLYRLVLRVS